MPVVPQGGLTGLCGGARPEDGWIALSLERMVGVEEIDGAGNTMKAINNMMSSVNSHAMMEGLAVGLKSGLDAMVIYDVCKASSGGSKALERIPRAIVPRNFEPGFKVQLMNKDLETFNTIAKELHVPVSFSNMSQHYHQAAMAAGLADKDTSVCMTIIEQLAAIKPTKR